MVAELLFLTPRRGYHIRKVGLPGVIITDDLARKLDEEALASDGGRAAAYRRLALQIVGVRHMGYAGAQVSGLHAYPKVARLLEEVENVARQCPTLEDWWQAWREALATADGRSVRVAPAHGLYLKPPGRIGRDAAGPTGAAEMGIPEGVVSAPLGEYARFKAMDALDHLLFRDGSSGAHLVGPLLRRTERRSGVGGILLRVEQAIKEPLLGCQGCGFCRLPHTAYVCPETCPKGLANGPCGGTQDNMCEFGDRECIYSQIYRVSRKAGLLAHLEEVLIPPVPDAAWGSCSWVNHFRKEGPRVIRLPPSGRM